MLEVSHQINLFKLRWLLNVRKGQIFGSYIFLILQLTLTGQHVEFCSPVQMVHLSKKEGVSEVVVHISKSCL